MSSRLSLVDTPPFEPLPDALLVEDNRLQEQQQANQISKRLSETTFPTDNAIQAPALAEITDLPSDTDPLTQLPQTERGDRFEFELLVETPDSIVNRADDRMMEILTEGIVLYRTDTLTEVVNTGMTMSNDS